MKLTNSFTRTISGFIRKELIQALRDPRMRIVLFLLPMVQMVVFGLAISNDVKNIRLAGAFSPHDLSSRELYERSIASGWFIPVSPIGEAPDQWIQSNQADAVLVSPVRGLDRAIERNEGEIQLLIDATNVIRAQGIESYVRSILHSMTSSPQSHQDPPLQLEVRTLYNPSMESTLFMVPGVMSLILCVVTILLTSMSLAREKEMGTFETIISAPISTAEVLIGKTLPYVFLGLIDIPLILAVASFLFGVPMRGPLWITFLAGLIFIGTSVAIGTLISTYSKNQQQAMMGGFIFLFVATLLSGMMFPLENMPLPLWAIAQLNPLKYFIVLLRNLMLKGGAPEVIWTNLGVLTVMGFIAISAAFRRFKPTLNS